MGSVGGGRQGRPYGKEPIETGKEVGREKYGRREDKTDETDLRSQTKTTFYSLSFRQRLTLVLNSSTLAGHTRELGTKGRPQPPPFH